MLFIFLRPCVQMHVCVKSKLPRMTELVFKNFYQQKMLQNEKNNSTILENVNALFFNKNGVVDWGLFHGSKIQKCTFLRKSTMKEKWKHSPGFLTCYTEISLRSCVTYKSHLYFSMEVFHEAYFSILKENIYENMKIDAEMRQPRCRDQHMSCWVAQLEASRLWY